MRQANQHQQRRRGGATGGVASRGPAPQNTRTPGRAIELVGATSDASDLTRRLALAADHGHLVTPAMAAAHLPEGTSVVISQVLIDQERETYNVEGKRALSKTALDRIAAAAGVSWHTSKRIGERIDPHRVEWYVAGTVRHFDGTESDIVGSKEMDLRDGSDQLTGKSARQIAQLRAHIVSHAESKARLRAIRSLGIRSSYEPEELRKPFVVARLMFTGQSSDPATRAMFAATLAASMLGGRRALYGASPAALPALGGGVRAEEDAPPPVVDEGVIDEPEPSRGYEEPAYDDEPDYDDAYDMQPEDRGPSGFTVPGGREKGMAIEDASDDTLRYWEDRIAGELAAGRSRAPARDERLVAAMQAEIDYRGAR